MGVGQEVSPRWPEVRTPVGVGSGPLRRFLLRLRRAASSTGLAEGLGRGAGAGPLFLRVRGNVSRGGRWSRSQHRRGEGSGGRHRAPFPRRRPEMKGRRAAGGEHRATVPSPAGRAYGESGGHPAPTPNGSGR